MSFTNVTPTDRLYIKLYDDDVTTREFIASITLEIDQLDYSPKVCFHVYFLLIHINRILQ